MCMFTLHLVTEAGLAVSAVEEILTISYLADTAEIAVKIFVASLVVKQATGFTEVRTQRKIAILAHSGRFLFN